VDAATAREDGPGVDGDDASPRVRLGDPRRGPHVKCPRKKAVRKSPAERSDEIARAACDLALDQGLMAITLRAVSARIDVAPVGPVT